MEEKPLQQIINIRKEKLNKLLQQGINPFPNKFEYNYDINKIIEKFSYLSDGQVYDKENIIAKGRIILRREMGKSVFCHIQDFTGKIQIYFKKDILGEEKFRMFLDLIDIGDIIGDLNSRRAKITEMGDRGNVKYVRGTVPLAEMFGYATVVRSLSQGRASFNLEPSHYEEVPANIAKAIIEKRTVVTKG